MHIESRVLLLKPGMLINERYLVERLIGQGGMGAVYEALDQRLNGAVALKQTTTFGDHSTRAFEREAQLLARLRHPALPKVIDYFTDETGKFLVMEFFPGNDLAHLLEQRNEPFPLDQVLAWADQLLRALGYLHRQEPPVIHRDIKPQNLKLTAEHEIVLLDFGLAKSDSLLQSRVTRSGSIYGYTPMYAPLEQIQGTGTNPRSDMYALSATLHHLLTGKPPVDALTRASAVVSKQADPHQSAHRVQPNVPEAVGAVLLQGMALAAEDRFASAQAMQNALNHARRQGGGAASATTTSAPPPVPASWEAETRLQNQTPPLPTRRTVQPMPSPARPPTNPPAKGASKQATPETMAREQAQHEHHTHRNRKDKKHDKKHDKKGGSAFVVFFPRALVGVGVLWLLSNLNVLPFDIQMGLLGQMWPIFLVLVGIDILSGGRRWIKVLGGTLAAVVVVALLAVGSAYVPDMQTTNRAVAMGDTEYAAMELDLAGAASEVYVMDDSENLIEAAVTYRGGYWFDVQGDAEKSVRLGLDEHSSPADWISGAPLQRWTIGLNREVPLELVVAGGKGETILDLRGLELVGLELEAGFGNVEALLPATGERYPVRFAGGGGDFELSVADNAVLDLEIDTGASEFDLEFGEGVDADVVIDGGFSRFAIDIPDDAAVQIEILDDEDDVNLPRSFEQVDRGEEYVVWETPGFDEADSRIVIQFLSNVSELDVR